MPFKCSFFCLLQFRFSSINVVFSFNASLNDVAPVPPILFPVYLVIMKKSVLLMDATCVLFLLSSQLRLRSVNVVFDFNASLNDVAPVSLMLLPVDLMQMEEVNY